MKKRFSDEQIISILREAEAGVSARELCRKHAISDATFYTWRKKYGGMEVPEVKRLKSLEEENARLKKLLAEAMLDKEALQVALRRKYKRHDLTPKSCSIQEQNSGMIMTHLNGGCADEKVTIHRRADCFCPEAG